MKRTFLGCVLVVITLGCGTRTALLDELPSVDASSADAADARDAEGDTAFDARDSENADDAFDAGGDSGVVVAWAKTLHAVQILDLATNSAGDIVVVGFARAVSPDDATYPCRPILEYGEVFVATYAGADGALKWLQCVKSDLRETMMKVRIGVGDEILFLEVPDGSLNDSVQRWTRDGVAEPSFSAGGSMVDVSLLSDFVVDPRGVAYAEATLPVNAAGNAGLVAFDPSGARWTLLIGGPVTSFPFFGGLTFGPDGQLVVIGTAAPSGPIDGGVPTAGVFALDIDPVTGKWEQVHMAGPPAGLFSGESLVTSGDTLVGFEPCCAFGFSKTLSFAPRWSTPMDLGALLFEHAESAVDAHGHAYLAATTFASSSAPRQDFVRGFDVATGAQTFTVTPVESGDTATDSMQLAVQSEGGVILGGAFAGTIAFDGTSLTATTDHDSFLVRIEP